MRPARGFTLVELVVTIVLLGILSAVAGVFIVNPVRAYFAAQRRAELTDVADTALRRFARDLKLALPNSIRVTSGAVTYVEYLATRTGGRYRAEVDDGTVAGEEVLSFVTNDTQFDTTGSLSTAAGQAIVPNSDRIVIHNLGIPGADAWAGDNSSLITGVTTPSGAIANEDRLQISGKKFPLESPGQRFHVISGPVTYECAPGAADANGDGTGELRRISGYAIQAAQPTGSYGAGMVSALLAKYVTDCEIRYTTLALQGRGLVSLRIRLTRGGETVTLYHEAHVSNVP